MMFGTQQRNSSVFWVDVWKFIRCPWGWFWPMARILFENGLEINFLVKAFKVFIECLKLVNLINVIFHFISIEWIVITYYWSVLIIFTSRRKVIGLDDLLTDHYKEKSRLIERESKRAKTGKCYNSDEDDDTSKEIAFFETIDKCQQQV